MDMTSLMWLVMATLHLLVLCVLLHSCRRNDKLSKEKKKPVDN